MRSGQEARLLTPCPMRCTYDRATAVPQRDLLTARGTFVTSDVTLDADTDVDLFEELGHGRSAGAGLHLWDSTKRLRAFGHGLVQPNVTA